MRNWGNVFLAYSCAEICWSASRQALIFNRRQTQQRFSSSGAGGPAKGVHRVPHTPQRLAAGVRSDSTDFFAKSRISGAMIGSAVDFFFMVDFTIVQKPLIHAQLPKFPAA